MSERKRWTIWLVGCVFLANAQLHGQGGLAKTEDSANATADAKRIARMKELAESFEVYADNDRKELAKLKEQPIFRWANPQREAIGGAAFLWTHRGRPHASIGIWTYDDTKATDSFELQSMSEKPFKSSASFWRTQSPGIIFKRFAPEETPAGSKARRLIQMRQLARKNFSATLNANTDREEKLRFLPTPVYRYEELPKHVIDGTMFSFAQGTDPEVFLLLEARDDNGAKKWYYAFANQTSERTEATFQDKVVWTSRESQGTFHMTIRRPVEQGN